MQFNSANKWSQSTSINTQPTANAVNQNLNTSSSNSTPSESKSTIVSISTLTGLLSTLCRSSDSINKEILDSAILDSIEKALYGDERCVLDTMRFLDLLLTLIFEGRQALKKQAFPIPNSTVNTTNVIKKILIKKNYFKR